MTMRLDIVTNDAGELVRREHARDLGAGVVLAIYRLAKLAQMHDLANQAFTRQLEQTQQQINEYGLRAGMNINILFAQRAVFVAGQLLKGSHKTYEMAAELGDMLEWCGGQELTVQRDVSAAELYDFAEALSLATRSEKGVGLALSTDKIRLRPVADAARLRGLEVENLTHEQRIVRNYASAVVIMRRFFEDLSRSRYILPRRIKRVAQNLVDLSAGATPAFLGVTEVRNQNHDAAGRAANTAILAVAMARELTNDRGPLAQIAMAAMMHDVGRPRAASIGAPGGGPMPGMSSRISEDAEDKLAAGTAAVLTALGRVNEPTINRTVIAFEALWLRRQQWVGPVYGGLRPVTLQSKILSIARRYNDLLTPDPGLLPPPPDFAVATLFEELKDPADRSVLRLLVSALRLFPVGTAVQLSTGEVGEVLPTTDRRPPDRPLLRLLMDSVGGVYDEVIDFDLAGDPTRRIVKVVNVDGWSKGLATSPTFGQQGMDDEDGGPVSGSSSVPSIPSVKSISDAQREAPSNPGSRGGGSGSGSNPAPGYAAAANPSGILERRQSYPSWGTGTSPSMVGEAMGRVMAESMGPPVPSGDQRTVVGQLPLEDLAPPPPRGNTNRHRGGVVGGQWVSESIRVPKDKPATARGTLASTPILHTLVYMFDHEMNGSVLLRETVGTQHAIYFAEGAPAKAKTGRSIAMLGAELASAGVLQADSIPSAVDSARRFGTLLGEYLVGEGLISRDQLADALRSQIVGKVASLVNLPPETDYAFYQDVNVLETWAGGELTPCHPLNAILASARSWYDRARIRATLGRIAKQPLSLHPQSDLSQMILTADESAVVDAIRTSRTTISTLYQQQIADEEVVSSLVYTLAVTRCFAFTASRGAPMGARAILSSPPPAISIAPEAVAQEQADTSESPIAVVEEQAAYEVAVPSQPALPYEVEVEPTTDEVAALASRPPVSQHSAPRIMPAAVWRPPPSPPANWEMANGEEANLEMANANANQEMGDDGRSHTSPPPPPAADQGEMEEAEAALQAMTDFRLAEAALQRNELDKAERLAKKAAHGEPANGEYVALLAWIEALSGRQEAVQASIAKLGLVLKEDAMCERALLYRGKLLKRAGRVAEALRDFQTVLDVNPRNNEAASEARLLRMQKKKK